MNRSLPTRNAAAPPRRVPAPLAEERGKLTREQVIDLRSRATAGETPAALARAYGLSWTGAKKIIAAALC